MQKIKNIKEFNLYKTINKEKYDNLLNQNCNLFNSINIKFYYRCNANDDYLLVELNKSKPLSNYYTWIFDNSIEWNEFPKIYEMGFFSSSNNLFQEKGNLYQLSLYDLDSNNKITKIGISKTEKFIDSFQLGLGNLFGVSNLSLEDFNKIFYNIFNGCYKSLPKNKLKYIDYLTYLIEKLYTCNINKEKLIENLKLVLETNKKIKNKSEIITITELLNPNLNKINYMELNKDLKINQIVELWTESSFLLKKI